jgi:hypothetical protein
MLSRSDLLLFSATLGHSSKAMVCLLESLKVVDTRSHCFNDPDAVALSVGEQVCISFSVGLGLKATK